MARATRSKRGMGFTQAECMNLLELVDEYLPIAAEEWEAVAVRHAAVWPETERTREGLKRKYNDLANKKKPTGDPTCPEHVRFAKEIRLKLNEKSQMSEGGTESEDDSVSVVDIADPVETNEPTTEQEQEEKHNSDHETEPENLQPGVAATDNSVVETATHTASTQATVAPASQNAAGTTSTEKAPPTRKAKRKASLTRISRPRSRTKQSDTNNDIDINQIFKLQMLQRQQDREEERERRQYQMELEQRRHEQQSSMFQQVMMMMVATSAPSRNVQRHQNSVSEPTPKPTSTHLPIFDQADAENANLHDTDLV